MDDGASLSAAGPRLQLYAGGGGAAPSELAELCEWFNQDPFVMAAEPNNRGDAYWGLPLYASVIAVPVFLAGATAGSFMGLELGSITVLPEVDTQVAVHLRYDFATDHWHAVVINKWAAVGHRRFDVDLGTSAALGVWQPSIGAPNHLEIVYHPNVRVEFLIDGKVVKVFTDAGDGGADTPLAGIYAQRHAVGSTIKGAGIYTTTGATGTPAIACAFFDLYTETPGVL